MPTNSYVRWWGDTNEQNLLQNLMTEAIKFHGLDVIYMPRSMRREDTLYNEDILSKFTQTFPIEVYLKNVMGWDGQGNFLSKFGLRVDDKMSVMISRERFEELIPRARFTSGQITVSPDDTEVSGTNTKFKTELRVGDEITTTSSGQTRVVATIKNNTTLTVTQPFTYAVANEYFAVAAPPNIALPPSRPMEGDLIFFPAPLHVIMEIKYIQHEKSQGQFYPLGKLTFYEVDCEIWSYSHEVLQTGDTDVDAFAQQYEFQVSLEMAEGGTGTYDIGESVYQGNLLTDATATGNVVSWDAAGRVLRIGNMTGEFTQGLLVKGDTSGAEFYLGDAPDRLLLPSTKAADNQYLDDEDNSIIDRREINRIFGGV